MNIGRARQIVESPNDIEVHFQGVPIWIQHLNEDTETARVYVCADPEDEQEVPVAQLTEIQH